MKDNFPYQVGDYVVVFSNQNRNDLRAGRVSYTIPDFNCLWVRFVDESALLRSDEVIRMRKQDLLGFRDGELVDSIDL